MSNNLSVNDNVLLDKLRSYFNAEIQRYHKPEGNSFSNFFSKFDQSTSSTQKETHHHHHYHGSSNNNNNFPFWFWLLNDRRDNQTIVINNNNSSPTDNKNNNKDEDKNEDVTMQRIAGGLALIATGLGSFYYLFGRYYDYVDEKESTEILDIFRLRFIKLYVLASPYVNRRIEYKKKMFIGQTGMITSFLGLMGSWYFNRPDVMYAGLTGFAGSSLYSLWNYSKYHRRRVSLYNTPQEEIGAILQEINKIFYPESNPEFNVEEEHQESSAPEEPTYPELHLD